MNRNNWQHGKLEDICEIIMGQSPPSDRYNSEKNGLPFYQGKAEFGDVYPMPRKWCSKPLKLAEKNDILISVRAPVGPTNICNETSCIGRGLAAIRYFVKDEHKFIFYYLRSIESEVANIGTGSTFSAISKSQISNLKIPIPPLLEQHRIVGKIEELFTKLDAGVEALKKIKAQLKRYRQAVLKYAFEGKLTEGWREAHKGELEPASVLLERIKEQRKKEAIGKLKELPPIDTSDLPDLPEGWVWTTFEHLIEPIPNAIKAGPFGSSLKKEFYVSQGFKIYGQEQVIKGDPFYGDYYIDQERFESLKSCAVKPGDILISLVGTIGKVLILPERIEPGIINPRLVKVSLEKSAVNSNYVKTYFESSNVAHYFSTSSHGETMNILNLSILKRLPIPLPPLKEQIVLIESIERYFSIADEMEKVAEQTLKQSQRLRQSILKRAFEGRLIPQDPTDEPAERLLERINSEKHRKGSINQTLKRRK